MKKLLIGCGVISLLTVALITGAIVYLVVKARNFGTAVEKEIAAIQQLENQYAFTPPENLEMDPGRLDQYFAIRSAMTDSLKSHAFGKMVLQADEGQPPEMGVTGLFSLFPMIKELMTDFRTELEQREMAPSEYRWHMTMVYMTLYEGAQQGNQEMEEILEALRQGAADIEQAMKGEGTTRINQTDADVGAMVTMMGTEVEAEEIPATNFELVAEHKEELLEVPQLAFIEAVFYFEMMKEMARTQTARTDALNSIEEIRQESARLREQFQETAPEVVGQGQEMAESTMIRLEEILHQTQENLAQIQQKLENAELTESQQAALEDVKTRLNEMKSSLESKLGKSGEPAAP